MKNSIIAIFSVVLITLLLTSCEKDQITLTDPVSIENNQSLDITTIDFIKHHPAADSKDAYAISIGYRAESFYISTNKDQATTLLSDIKKANETQEPLSIQLSEQGEVLGVRFLTEEEITTFKATSPQLDPTTNRTTSTSRNSYSKRFFSYNQVVEVFRYLKKQDCSNYYTNIDQCIPFQYKRNGCFARAHKMKQAMEQQYRKTCDKIFAYGRLKNGCSFGNRWYYHVAPIVYVGSTAYVLDPSLDKYAPLTVSEWKAKMDPRYSPNFWINKVVVKRGHYYMPVNQTDESEGYYTDYHIGVQENMNTTLRRQMYLNPCDWE